MFEVIHVTASQSALDHMPADRKQTLAITRTHDPSCAFKSDSLGVKIFPPATIKARKGSDPPYIVLWGNRVRRC